MTLIGQDWGLRTESARLFDAGQGVQISRCPWLSKGGEELRRRCCLGARARFDRLDRFGRRVSHPCCSGNIFPILGTSPGRCSEEESFAAMGVDLAHMSYSRLAKAILPPFAQHLCGQLTRHILRARFGVDVPHFDLAHEMGPRVARMLNHRCGEPGSLQHQRGWISCRAGSARRAHPQRRRRRRRLKGWSLNPLQTRSRGG